MDDLQKWFKEQWEFCMGLTEGLLTEPYEKAQLALSLLDRYLGQLAEQKEVD